VLAALDSTADEKLTGLALRLLLSEQIGTPHEGQPDGLTEAEQVFAPKKPKPVKAKLDTPIKANPTTAYGGQVESALFGDGSGLAGG
jgi:ParB family chromosome partitioning protein